jgi:hypothetical protein
MPKKVVAVAIDMESEDFRTVTFTYRVSEGSQNRDLAWFRREITRRIGSGYYVQAVLIDPTPSDVEYVKDFGPVPEYF